MGLRNTFIVLKCHIYLEQMKEDCVENKTVFKKNLSLSRTMYVSSSHQEMGLILTPFTLFWEELLGFCCRRKVKKK